MKKKSILILLFLFVTDLNFGQIVQSKIIDNGGSGHYKSVAVTEESLKDFVVYRPLDIHKTVKEEGKLPVIIWANGGCMDSSIHHERLLTEVASHGYLIIAIGKLQMTVEERVHKSTPDNEMLKAMDWVSAQSKIENSDYFNTIDLDKMAVAGMSCGGAQTLGIASDNRIKTYMIFNAGMGDMTMAGASKASLKALHANIIYIVGGETDIAYNNALLDFERIDHVPIAFASHESAGHGGTFAEEFGGSFARMALDWLDWQFKDKAKNSSIFLKSELNVYPKWSMKSKNFPTSNIEDDFDSEQFTAPKLEFVCELKVTIDQPINLGKTSEGERVVIPITGGIFEGPKLKGTVLKGGADYQYVNSDGTRTQLDAQYTIKTDDDILIKVRNKGLIYTHEHNNPSEVYFRAAPKFEAPINSKYSWLNNAIFICKPVGKEDYISIQVWKVL